MPCISASYNPVSGPIIQVAILPPSFATAPVPAQTASEQTSNPRFYAALVDTGASVTCISSKVVSEVGLAPSGKGTMLSASHTVEVNTFQFGVAFILNPTQNPTGEISANLMTRFVDGMEFNSGASVFDVLLGRDVICSGVFSLTFDGHMVLAF